MRKIFYSLILCLSGLYLVGCSDDPTSLGKNFFTGQGLKLDSLILVGTPDTATAKTYYTPTPHYGVRYLLVGRSQADNLEAQTLLNFNPKLVAYNDLFRANTNPIDSAQLILNPLYQYGADTTETMTITGHVVNSIWNYSTVTVDTTISYDANPIFTANLNDTSTIIPLNKNVVFNWFLASLDTNPVGVNYGLLLKPTGNISKHIVGLEALTSSASYPPTLKVYVHRNGAAVDSFSYYVNTNTHLVYPARHDSVSGIILQSGVASKAFLQFKLNQLPKDVIINSAYLTLHQDTLNSKYGSVGGSLFTSACYAYADSVGASEPLTVDYNYYGALSSSNGVSTANIFGIVNRFYLLGQDARIILRNSYYEDGVEKYLFYDPQTADRSKRPLLKIYYTKRGNQ